MLLKFLYFYFCDILFVIERKVKKKNKWLLEVTEDTWNKTENQQQRYICRCEKGLFDWNLQKSHSENTNVERDGYVTSPWKPIKMPISQLSPPHLMLCQENPLQPI